jgi:hypothetical protein
MDSDSRTTLESHGEEDHNNSRGITWISYEKLVKSPYLLLKDHPNAPQELGYRS